MLLKSSAGAPLFAKQASLQQAYDPIRGGPGMLVFLHL
jgi:hypothetical protein